MDPSPVILGPGVPGTNLIRRFAGGVEVEPLCVVPRPFWREAALSRAWREARAAGFASVRVALPGGDVLLAREPAGRWRRKASPRRPAGRPRKAPVPT